VSTEVGESQITLTITLTILVDADDLEPENDATLEFPQFR
jgi:hypothetical protein